MRRVRLLLVLAAAACAGNAANTDGANTSAGPGAGDVPALPQPADTLRGIVRIVGAEPATAAVLETALGGTVQLSGATQLLRQLSGIEVALRGEQESGRFHVAQLTVRAVNGIAALDGTLRHEEGGYLLAVADGSELPLPYLPTALQRHVGARIWITGPLDRAPEAYGILE